MSAIKEPSFFSMDDVYARGLGWYGQLYRGHEEKAARGEASNSYSACDTFPHSIDRIAQTLCHPKFLYLVRHPRERTESDWMQRSKTESIRFSDFLRSDTVYADKNRYLRTFERYSARFGDDSIAILFYEDLVSDPQAVLRRVCDFLGVDSGYTFNTEIHHGRTTEARRFLPVMGWIRQSRLYADLSLRLPGRIKGLARQLLSTSYEVQRPSWTETDIQWFRDRFEGPSTDFLDRVGRERSLWDWQQGWV
jgi:hypothetical protein